MSGKKPNNKYLEKIINDYELVKPPFSELKQAFKYGYNKHKETVKANYKPLIYRPSFPEELNTNFYHESHREELTSLDRMKVRGYINFLLTDGLKYSKDRRRGEYDSYDNKIPGPLEEEILYIKQAIVEAHTFGMLKSSLIIQKKIGEAILQTGDRVNKKYLVNFLKEKLV